MQFLLVFIIFVCWAWNISLYSQTIKGIVVNEKDNPLSYVNIALLSLPDSTFIEGTISGDDGCFVLKKHDNSSALIRFSSIGYTTVYKPLSADLGTIVLTADTQLLQEIVIKGNLPITRVEGDALVTTIQNTVLSRAGSAGDVLARIPAIMKKDDTFEVFGKGTPQIYINGRKVRDMDELEQLNSDEIKQIELITNPSARYDASVKAVIRIRTIPRKGDGFGFDLRSTYAYAEKNQWHEQINMNYRHNNLDIFGSVTYRQNNLLQDSHISQTTLSESAWEQENDLSSAKLCERTEFIGGLNYTWGKENSAGMRYSLLHTLRNNMTLSMSSQVWKNEIFYDNWNSYGVNKDDYQPTHRLNAYYSGKVGQLSIDWDADYYAGQNKSRNNTHEDSQEEEDRDINSSNNIDNQLIATRIILSHPLGGGNMTLGGEYSYTHRHDDYLSANDFLPTSYSKIKEQNTAAFIEYNRSFSFGSFTLGMRYEHAGFDYYENELHIKDQSRNYDDFFPHMGYTTTWGKLQIQASYTAKIARPSYQYLSNNISYINRFTLQKGNPTLRPTLIHDLSLATVWRFLTAMVSYQHRHDDIIYWSEQTTDNEAVTMVQNKNIRCIPMLNVYIGATPKIGCWLPKFGIGLSKQWLSMETTDGNKSMNKPVLTTELGNTFSLPQKWQINMDVAFQGKGYYQNVYSSKNIYTCNVSVKKSWMNDALSLELRCKDLFHSRKDGNIVWADRLRIDQCNVINSRECALTLRYKFNSAKNKYKGKEAGQNEIERF